VLSPLRRLGQGCDHLQSSGQMANSLHIRRALECLLSGALPVAHSLIAQSSLGIVVSHELGLRLDGLGEALGQHLGNTLVELLPGALE
jgi:hypothetical protein